MRIYRESAPVGIAEVLNARELRAARQRERLRGGTLVWLTMNVPGAVKVTPPIGEAFEAGVSAIAAALGGTPEIFCSAAGLEACFRTARSAAEVKREMARIEDANGVGRLLDIDVLGANGAKIAREAVGLAPRSCLLCGGPAFVCARSRAHGLDALRAEIDRRIAQWRADALPARIGAMAVAALMREAETTPKPGLVDKRNCGSHPDMSLDLLRRSALSLDDYFVCCARTGFAAAPNEDIFPALQRAGVAAEETMLRATGGVNAHRGAIFSLGLLCAAAAQCLREYDAPAERICRLAGKIAAPHIDRALAALTPDTARSFGERLYVTAGIRGARGEAASGFPSLTRVALPALEKYAALGPEAAGARALIHLLAQTDDTTLIRRGGLARAGQMRAAAQKMAAGTMTRGELLALDDLFISENLTCGGCADLLACAYFLQSAAEESLLPDKAANV